MKTSSPAKADWHPDSSTYCGDERSLSQELGLETSDRFTSQLWAAAAADSAPSAAARSAAVTLYNDIMNRRDTSKDLSSLLAVYSCPSG